MSNIERPRGTRDFGPAEMAARRRLEQKLRGLLERWGYREVQTPTFEHLELFTAKSGPGVVDQLYAFKDKGERELTLRPELTAPVLRYYVSDLQMAPKPLRLHYFGPCFRYERPQSGRYREFWQFGTELIGADGPEGDAEIIALAQACVQAAGVREHALRVGHIGLLRTLVKHVPEAQRAETFRRIDKDDAGLEAFLLEAGTAAPVAALVGRASGLTARLELGGGASEVQARIEAALDPARRAFGGAAGALPPADLAEVETAFKRLADVLLALSAMAGGITVHVDFGVARGLDYYTGVVFEIEAPDLGAEKQVLGGGAYALAELFGGSPVASVGFGLGFDRVLLAAGETPRARPVDAHMVPIGEAARFEAARIAQALRGAGLHVSLDVNRRNPSKNLDYANAIGARHAVILGSKELERGVATVKDLATGNQDEVPVAQLAKRLGG